MQFGTDFNLRCQSFPLVIVSFFLIWAEFVDILNYIVQKMASTDLAIAFGHHINMREMYVQVVVTRHIVKKCPDFIFFNPEFFFYGLVTFVPHFFE